MENISMAFPRTTSRLLEGWIIDFPIHWRHFVSAAWKVRELARRLIGPQLHSKDARQTLVEHSQIVVNLYTLQNSA